MHGEGKDFNLACLIHWLWGRSQNLRREVPRTKCCKIQGSSLLSPALQSLLLWASPPYRYTWGGLRKSAAPCMDALPSLWILQGQKNNWVLALFPAQAVKKASCCSGKGHEQASSSAVKGKAYMSQAFYMHWWEMQLGCRVLSELTHYKEE